MSRTESCGNGKRFYNRTLIFGNRPVGPISKLKVKECRGILWPFLLCYKQFFPDVLVLNAAMFGSPERSVVKTPVEELRNLLEVNLVANYQLVQGLIGTIQQGEFPRVVVIGSTAGIRKGDGSVYGISKWALRSYVCD